MNLRMDKPKLPNDQLEYEVMPQSREAKPALPASKNRMFWIIIAAVLLLSGVGYLTYWRFFRTEPAKTPESRNIIVDELSKDEDRDNDGLSGRQEKEKGTDPKSPDTDKDGLADGDEVNIYFSDPLLFDTDADGFEDGKEVAGGFSPIVNTPERASSEELGHWTEKIAQFGLHEPTKTTLKLKAPRLPEEQMTITYTNQVYQYSIEVPKILATREADSGRKVGIYIKDVIPEDPEVMNDPISISVAVKVPEQNLDEWVNGQYQQEKDYQTKQELEINSIKIIQLTDMRNETIDGCNANRAFFPKNGVIIIVTWNCTQLSAFAELYNQIVQSFKFIK